MAYQFFRVECYSRVASKKKSNGLSLRDVTNENARVPGSCPHVKHPVPPKTIYGVTPSQLADIAEDRSLRAMDATGKRKLRSDALIAVCAVASFPYTVEECKADKELAELYRHWEKDTIKFALKEFNVSACGANGSHEDKDVVVSIVRHVKDEPYPHLHINIACPLVDERIQIEDIHCGRKASAEAKNNGLKKGDQNKAYINEMKAFQDRYSDVASKYGMARIGAGRQRLTRKEHLSRKQDYQALMRLHFRVEKLRAIFKKSFKKAGQKIKALVLEVDNLEKQKKDLQGAEVNKLKDTIRAQKKRINMLEDSKHQLVKDRQDAFDELNHIKQYEIDKCGNTSSFGL